jgi:hypothetical protein
MQNQQKYNGLTCTGFEKELFSFGGIVTKIIAKPWQTGKKRNNLIYSCPNL